GGGRGGRYPVGGGQRAAADLGRPVLEDHAAGRGAAARRHRPDGGGGGPPLGGNGWGGRRRGRRGAGGLADGGLGRPASGRVGRGGGWWGSPRRWSCRRCWSGSCCRRCRPR